MSLSLKIEILLFFEVHLLIMGEAFRGDLLSRVSKLKGKEMTLYFEKKSSLFGVIPVNPW